MTKKIIMQGKKRRMIITVDNGMYDKLLDKQMYVWKDEGKRKSINSIIIDAIAKHIY